MSSGQGTIIQDLQNSDFLCLIRSLLDLFRSCIGPNGGVKILVTGGGVLLTTSTSSRLLNNYTLSHPISILLSHVMKSQNSTFGDYGLYIGVLVCSILEKILKQDIMKQSEANKLLQNISSLISEVIKYDSVKLSLNFSTVKQLLPVVRTVISSKPGCGLSKQNIENLSIQIVKVFLSSVNDDFGDIVVVNSSLSEDFRIIDGISYQLETNEIFVQNLLSKMKEEYQKDIPLLLLNIMLTPTQLKRRDEEEIILEDDSDILKDGRCILEHAIKIGVKIIANQKVVHDSLKLFLQRSNVLLLDRLGTDLCECLKKLSGAKVVSSLGSSSINSLPLCVGTIDTVNYISHHHHSYVSLHKVQANVATLYVSSSSEEAFMETKVVVHQALRALRQITCQPYILPGAGCFEAWVAAQLSIKLLMPALVLLHFWISGIGITDPWSNEDVCLMEPTRNFKEQFWDGFRSLSYPWLVCLCPVKSSNV